MGDIWVCVASVLQVAGFCDYVVLTMALGIGRIPAIFTLVHGR